MKMMTLSMHCTLVEETNQRRERAIMNRPLMVDVAVPFDVEEVSYEVSCSHVLKSDDVGLSLSVLLTNIHTLDFL